MAVRTIKVADKPTADGIKSTVENNAAKLDGITKFLELGGYQITRNMAWKQ